MNLLKILGLSCVLVVLSACQPKPVTVKILHINDHHSHLEEDDLDLNINGQEVEMLYGGFPRIAAKIKEITAQNENVLKLHAGDAITGDLYFTLFEGEADAKMMNEICFDAFAVGNHEFDAGDAGLVKFLDFLREGDCNTPVLGANVQPGFLSPLAPLFQAPYIQPYTVKVIDGERIGIIGIDIAEKTQNSSNPDEGTIFLGELETAQKYIDKLETVGINKIILLTHYQYSNDIELAKNLKGVDVIVGGDSHSLLGSEFANEVTGLNPVGEYPTMANNANDEPVCIVQAWEYAKILGELDVSFDAEGRVLECSGTPHLLLGTTAEVNGEVVENIDQSLTVAGAVALHPYLSFMGKDADSQALLEGFQEQTSVLEQTVIATIPEDLCYERVPGQGRSTICNVSETISMGGDVPQLVAYAFREMLKTQEGNKPDISIQNAGGVRIDLPAGNFTLGDAYRLLPFANTMVILDLSGAEVKQSIEEGIEKGSGAYPYAAGLRFDVDAGKEFGSRITNVEVKASGATEWAPIDLTATYTVVTNSFAASGGDNYITFGNASDEGRAFDTLSEYATTFIDYAKQVLTLDKLDSSEYSTQSYTPAPSE